MRILLGVLILTVCLLLAPSAASGAPPQFTGQVGLFLAYVSWPGAENSAQENMEKAKEEVVSWYSASSDGRVSLEPATFLPVRLSAPLPSCQNTPQYWHLWTQIISAAAAGQGYDIPNDYDLIGLSLPDGFLSSCSIYRAGAIGFQTGSCRPVLDVGCGLSIYSPEYTQSHVIVHETLHNLWIRHANRASCPGDRLSYRSVCQSVEYGDRYDVMGASIGYYKMALLQSIFAEQLGWLEPGSLVQAPYGTNKFWLRPYASMEGQRVLKIPLASLRAFPNGAPDLYVEWRANIGRDSSLYSADGGCGKGGLAGGLLLRLRFPSTESAQRVLSDFSINRTPPLPTYKIDGNPGYLGSGCGIALLEGKSWTDPTGKIRLTFLNTINGQALLQVRKWR